MKPARLVRALGDFLKHEWKSLCWGLLLVITMQLIEYHGWLAGVEGRVLDLYVGYVPRAGTSPVPAPIVTVEIDDDAYRACFDGTSPMDPAKIGIVLRTLIGDDPASRPSVIGVDILTDSELSPSPYDALRSLSTSTSAPTKIIWIAPVLASVLYEPTFWEWLSGAEDQHQVEPGSVLGYPPREANDHRILWAIPVFPADEDLRLRRFPRTIRAVYDKSSVERETWARLVAVQYKPGCCGIAGDIREVIVTYGMPLIHYPLGKLFRCENHSIEPVAAGMNAFRDDLKTKHPLILVGGTFANARDQYQTSAGLQAGLFINAYAMQAEFAGNVMHEGYRPLLVLLDLIVSIVIVAVFRSRGSIQPVIRRSLLVLPVAVLLSLVAFSLGYVWLSVIGVAAGFMPHLLVEIYRKNPQLKD